MPLVKQGDAKVAAGDIEGGLALFQEAVRAPRLGALRVVSAAASGGWWGGVAG